jgi:NarL family two-component system response regulator LiaR
VHDPQGWAGAGFYLAPMSTPPPTRVLIADDHKLFAETLALTLDADPRVEVAGYAGDGREAVKLAVALDPDVVLMDLDMPLVDGIEATRAICRSLPTRVAVLTGSPNPEDALRARDAGAAAYLTKGCSAQEVVEAVLELSTPADSRRKEVTRGERGMREARAAGLPHDLLQFRTRLAH